MGSEMCIRDRWYVDGRMYFHLLVDPKNPKKGIVGVRMIDPIQIKKIREVQKKKNAQGIEVIDKVDEYYTYNQGGFEKTYVAGVGSQTLKISPDAIVYCTSGMMDANRRNIIGYMHKGWLLPDLTFGLNLSNLGPKVSFIDPDQADPQPTNLTLGLNYAIIISEFNKLNLVYDVDKLLVSSYPDMDWDSDGYIGGYDEDGDPSPGNDYNKEGKLEIAHTDPIYLAIFTSWFDDWFLGGDIDKSASDGQGDKIIGGYDWIDNDEDGNIDLEDGEIVQTPGAPGDPGWGKYNEWGQKEVGNTKDRGISDELDKLVHNLGVEYWYGKYFAIRTGFYYYKTGKINNPTFGIGLRFAGYGFDFGYTYGETGHPLTNTMRFSLNMAF